MPVVIARFVDENNMVLEEVNVTSRISIRFTLHQDSVSINVDIQTDNADDAKRIIAGFAAAKQAYIITGNGQLLTRLVCEFQQLTYTVTPYGSSVDNDSPKLIQTLSIQYTVPKTLLAAHIFETA